MEKVENDSIFFFEDLVVEDSISVEESTSEKNFDGDEGSSMQISSDDLKAPECKFDLNKFPKVEHDFDLNELPAEAEAEEDETVKEEDKSTIEKHELPDGEDETFEEEEETFSEHELPDAKDETFEEGDESFEEQELPGVVKTMLRIYLPRFY